MTESGMNSLMENIPVPNRTGMQDAGFVRAEELSAENEDALATPLLPELTIPLSEIVG
jgi:hypothetical protein